MIVVQRFQMEAFQIGNERHAREFFGILILRDDRILRISHVIQPGLKEKNAFDGSSMNIDVRTCLKDFLNSFEHVSTVNFLLKIFVTFAP